MMKTIKGKKTLLISFLALVLVFSVFFATRKVAAQSDNETNAKTVEIAVGGQEDAINKDLQSVITSSQAMFQTWPAGKPFPCDGDTLCYLVNGYAPINSVYVGPPDVQFVEIPQEYIKQEPEDLEKIRATYCGWTASDISTALTSATAQLAQIAGPNYEDEDPPTSLDWSKTQYADAYASYIGASARAIAAQCSGYSVASVAKSLPTKITATVTKTNPVCFDDPKQKPTQSVSGTYRGKSYTISYYQTGKTLTWFGGPTDRGVTSKEKGSVTGVNLRGATGNYSAYPLSKNLSSGSKVVLPKESFPSESNVATNSVLNGNCLHVCKVGTIKDGDKTKKVKAELWLPVVDRGPRGNLVGKIDISPAGYKSLKDTLQLKGGLGGDGLSGFDVQLENCQ